MKIVTYNVNGLRPRVSQFGSLRRLLDSFDADIICFQETKMARQELKSDLVQAEGYESFFSCTRTSERGRTGYSGVATFCRVKSAFSSDEVALPVSAEEGFTGVLKFSSGLGSKKGEYPSIVEGLEDFSTDELLKIDGEGRCIITDHDHFVLFNIYGPRATRDDIERIQFKLKFFNILQKRWESLLSQGRRIFVVGDLNIAPSAIDCCEAGPDFEKNEFRTWFRSLLVRNGGAFFDVFREKHPERREAYTCWPTNSGAEEFNYGTRIDHILCAGPCLHKEEDNQEHSLVTCHAKECDILEQFKRWKPGNTPRHKEINSSNAKLEGSDHAPVYMSLAEIPNIQQHNTPSLSSRYCPQVYGCQQTLVSMFTRRLSAEVGLSGGSSSISDDRIVVERCSQLNKRPLHSCNTASSDLTQQGALCTSDDYPEDSYTESSSASPSSRIGHDKSLSSVVPKKKPRQSQLSLKSFFQKTLGPSGDSNKSCSDMKLLREDVAVPICESKETLPDDGENDAAKELQSSESNSVQDDMSQPSERENNTVALVEWQRIQQLMQTSIPNCKGHKEPCVSRVVKKSGPNLGRRFYVCARAEGPASNPEANCGFFKWATTNPKNKK